MSRLLTTLFNSYKLMSTSIKLVSPTNAEKCVFITHESGWKNTKIYADGKLIETYKDPQVLKEGVRKEIDGLGNLHFKIHPATLAPSLMVDGEKFAREKRKRAPSEGVNGLIAIFAVLAFMNLLMFLIIILQSSENEYPGAMEVQRRFIALGVLFTLLYTAAAILIARGVNFMYFLATGFFFISTVWVGNLLFSENEPPTLAIVVLFLPRVIILGLLATYFKRILNSMKAPKENSENEILDDNF